MWCEVQGAVSPGQHCLFRWVERPLPAALAGVQTHRIGSARWREMAMNFVRNQWYVAAYSAEVGHGLLARTILGESIGLYRNGGGPAVALAGRCVHRHFPLSESRLVGDTIVCGYHGFTYGADGRCVAVPGQQR